jgi:hypothetical protein
LGAILKLWRAIFFSQSEALGAMVLLAVELKFDIVQQTCSTILYLAICRQKQYYRILLAGKC